MAITFGITLQTCLRITLCSLLKVVYNLALKPQLFSNIVTTMHNTAYKKLARCTKCLLRLKEKQLTSKSPVLSVITIAELFA